MKIKVNSYWLLALIPIAFFGWYFLAMKKAAPLIYLPYYGPKQSVQTGDTSYHTVSDFSFVDQNGKPVDQNTIKNKIYVTEYFFTTCKSICPVMNSHLTQIHKEFKNEKDFLILSHTVDPETDSVSVLKEYAQQHGANDSKWLFLTGKKEDLYRVARKGYLITPQDGKGDEDDFIHTQNFALVDKERRIRGYYDGTDSLEIKRLNQDIKVLLKEYEYKSRINH
jgi:protein SCO1